ncbi:MAG: hypothetical protein AAFR75_09130 [Pseudomonadota bacterium]
MMQNRLLSAAAAFLLASTAAHAFQEQNTGAAPAQSPGAASKGQSNELGLGEGARSAPTPSRGTEVRIPGLGKLGVLPKMDFGLELLYGAAELPLAGDQQFSEPDSDGDLKVRGTVKHRF